MIEATSFRRETDAVLRMTTTLLRHVLPIFRKKKNGTPELVGSSLIVCFGESTFLVSAAHVFDDWQNLFFYIESGTTSKLHGTLLRTTTPSNEPREEDRIDIGVLKLADTYKSPFEKIGKIPVHLSTFRPRALPRERKQYVLVGFPETRSKVNRPARNIKSEAISFRNISAPIEKYAEVGVIPAQHIVMNLDLASVIMANGSIGSFPKPSGISGSPVWLLYDEIGHNDLTETPLVGIAIEYHKQAKVLVATDIEAALKLINAAIQ